MIYFTQGNLFEADAEALVNTVNTVGVMGKGIALEFKKRFPVNMDKYAIACNNQEVKTGKMFVVENEELFGPRWIVNFPTKKHWRNPSKMEWIESGLNDLRRFIVENDVKSIAIPALGCSNGQLSWVDVKSKIEKKLSNMDGVIIFIYEPLIN